MKESIGLRAKTYNYFMFDNDESKKKQKVQKMCNKKKNLNLKIIKIVNKHPNLRTKISI